MYRSHREGEGREGGGGRLGRPVQEEAAAAAADALHEPAAAGARGHFPAKPLPRHEHARGDRGVDQPDRGARAGENTHIYSNNIIILSLIYNHNNILISLIYNHNIRIILVEYYYL